MQKIYKGTIGAKTLIVFVVFLTICISTLKAQKTEELPDAYLFDQNDEFDKIFDLVSNYQFLYTSLNYSNKTYFAGRDLGIDQFNVAPQIFYLNSNGLMVGVSGAIYNGLIPKWNTTELSIGYSHNLGKVNNLTYRTSYGRYFFSKNDSVTPSFNNSIGLGFSYRNHSFGTRIDGALLFGKETSVQVTGEAYYEISLLKLGKYDKLYLKPEVSVYFGNEETLLLKNLGLRNRQVLYYGIAYGWMNTELSLPLMVSYKNFDLEAGYNLNFPRALGQNSSLKRVSTFNLSIGYIISLN